jgi:hypothetical protein
MIRILSALLLLISATAFAQAPANAPVRIRGTVEKLDGTMMSVKTRSGEHLNVKLADNYSVTGIKKASLDDVGSGKFIGTTTVGERNGALIAEEIHIFPESMRGTGEGHRDWDLRPNSKMTNANVADVVKMGKDRVLTVKYKDGEKKIVVTPQTVITAVAPGKKEELTAGTPIIIMASEKQADSSVVAKTLYVGRSGPPAM